MYGFVQSWANGRRGIVGLGWCFFNNILRIGCRLGFGRLDLFTAFGDNIQIDIENTNYLLVNEFICSSINSRNFPF
jgi:hypothetical protein